ncbi:unnamed protein product [Larinioides sclopetarius]|uniref:NLE domain-containing protein n=1 Tax=Larinioides sclopetarius TaxID=280406 RepID=A0AAV2AL78_9ARAC
MKLKSNFILARFKDEAGQVTSNPLDLPVDITVDKLTDLCNSLLNKEGVPFLFFVNDVQIKDSLLNVVEKKHLGSEQILEITYAEQAVFRVRPVKRCTSSIPGHAEAITSASFSPDGSSQALALVYCMGTKWLKTGFRLIEWSDLHLGSKDRETDKKNTLWSQKLDQCYCLGTFTQEWGLPSSSQCFQRLHCPCVGCCSVSHPVLSEFPHRLCHQPQMGRLWSHLLWFTRSHHPSAPSK